MMQRLLLIVYLAAKLAKEYAKQEDGGVKSAAATERWSREREIKAIYDTDGLSFDQKQWMDGQLRAQWAKKENLEQKRATRQIYIAISGDQMKVGVSSLPLQRIDLLKAARPDISLFKSWDGDYSDEKELHKLLSGCAIGGEWFSHSPETIAIVESYMQNRQLADVHIPASKLAASIMNVGERSVERASTVIEKAVPELSAAVDAGKVSVSAAAVIAKQDQDIQRRLVAEDKLKRAAANPDQFAEARGNIWVSANGVYHPQLSPTRAGKICFPWENFP